MPRGAIVVLEDALTSVRTPSSLRDPDPYEIAVVLFTSGSTGTPKGVVQVHVALLRHAMSATYSNGIVSGDQIAFTGSFAVVGAYSRSLGALPRRCHHLRPRLPHRQPADLSRVGRGQPHCGDSDGAVGAARAHRRRVRHRGTAYGLCPSDHAQRRDPLRSGRRTRAVRCSAETRCFAIASARPRAPHGELGCHPPGRPGSRPTRCRLAMWSRGPSCTSSTTTARRSL